MVKKKSAAVVEKEAEKTEAVLTHGQSWYRDRDLPWCEKKVAIFKALKAGKAFSPEKAMSTVDLASAAKVTPRDVRHYCYHAKAAGLVEINVLSTKSYKFYLTEQGRACNPEKELKAATKSAKTEKSVK